jgi:tetratricopeptide (TPR) repeat protein
VRRIGAELNVKAVLEGSVRKDGDRVRITAQLIQADDGFHLWQQSYDREFRDVFEIEKDIAASVARSFNLSLTLVTRAFMRPRPAHPDAWHYYLRANAVFDSGSAEALSQSMAFLQQAVASDPGYALGWARMAHTQAVIAEGGFRPVADALRDAEEYSHKALRLNPSLAEAHHVDAKVKLLYRRDWRAAAEAFERALQLDPSNVEIRYEYAHFALVPQRRFEEADRQLRRALATNPLRISVRNELGSMYIKSGRYDLARAELEQALQIAPTAPGALVLLGMSESAQGRCRPALDRFLEAGRLRRLNWILGHRGYAAARCGDLGLARSVLAELRSRSPVPQVEIAAVEAGTGDFAAALSALEKADAELSPHLLWLRVDFRFAALAGEPRYRALVSRLHLQ